MDRYKHKEIEKKWQKKWKKDQLYKTDDSVNGKENYYQLTEFPYPSGNLHVGHWYAFCGPDIHARYIRMTGKNVLWPIGFDAFGLPAENAAIKNDCNPADWTRDNIAHMRKQIDSMGASFDRTREVVTCQSDYYKHTQWLFNKLFKAGLVERKTTEANWCSSCKTVLANEQVVSGACERCDTVVEKKQMPQWQIKITDYADRLIDDLDTLDWSEEIKTSQKNWIGRSEGAEISFPLVIARSEEEVKVFTTRPDTLFGVTYLVIAPEHELVQSLKKDITNWSDVEKYIQETQKKSDIVRMAEGKEKTGVKLDGITAINPANNEEIPVYIADYVLAHYGTGAVMAVPAHDQRDFDFAQKYDLPIQQVIAPCVLAKDNPPQDGLDEVRRDTVIAFLRNNENGKYAILDWHGTLEGTVTSIMGGIDDGETAQEAAAKEIREESAVPNARFVKKMRWVTDAKYCASHKGQNRHAITETFLFEVDNLDEQGEIDEKEQKIHTLRWVDEANMEKTLTPAHQKLVWRQLNKEQVLEGHGRLINSGKFDEMDSDETKKAITEFVNGKITKTYKFRDWGISRQRYWGCPIPLVHCEKCGWQSVSDDQLPVELPEVEDYLPNDYGQSPLSKNKEFMQATCPQCGGEAIRETDTMDTFVDSSWYFLRYTDAHNGERFAREEKLKNWMPVDFYSGGAEHTTLHLLYARFFHKALYDLGLVSEKEPFVKRMNRGIILGTDGNKMSKSKGNTLDPDDIVEKLGADTLRIYLAFIGPYNEVGNYPWNPQAIVGVRRFIERVWKLQEKISDEKGKDNEIDKILHKTLKQVTESIKDFKLNTGVAALMSCVNILEKAQNITKEQLAFFAQMLAPYAPHISEELWQTCGGTDSVHLASWLVVDESVLVEDMMKLAVQINGKVRDEISVVADADKMTIEVRALASEKIKKYVGDTCPKKIIYVKGRLINIVV